MSVFKTTFSRALRAIPSDNADIPYPTVITSGTNTAATSNSFEDSTATFIADNIKTGDIVYNTSNSASATVVEVIGDNNLILNADIFGDSGQEYIIYQASSQTGLGNQGCYLYIGDVPEGGGAINVTTIGGDIVVFNGISSGTILPVQVIKLHAAETSVNADKIRALW